MERVEDAGLSLTPRDLGLASGYFPPQRLSSGHQGNESSSLRDAIDNTDEGVPGQKGQVALECSPL